jgi:bacterioferritin-associated ferredoxin
VLPQLPAPYVEHLTHPRGVGDVTLAQAAGEVGSMVGGGGVRVTIAWREDGRRAVLSEVMARTFGSHALVAPASALVTTASGLVYEDAALLEPVAIERLLRGDDPDAPPLPANVQRACEPVVQAFMRALGVVSAGRPADPLGVGILVCRCLGVGDRQVRQSIREGARTPEQVGARCRAGTGCRSCRPDLWCLLDEELLPPTEAPGEARHPVARIVWARAGRELRCLGLRLTDVEVVDAPGTEGVVEIGLEATRERPETLELGAVAIVRHVLRETVGPHVLVRLKSEAPKAGA